MTLFTKQQQPWQGRLNSNPHVAKKGLPIALQRRQERFVSGKLTAAGPFAVFMLCVAFAFYNSYYYSPIVLSESHAELASRKFELDIPSLTERERERERETAVSSAVSSARNKSSASVLSCFAPNSEKWLEGPRHGNSDEAMSDEFVRTTILGISEAMQGTSKTNEILDQTICYKESRLLDNAEEELDEKSIRLWFVRLIYMALHHHQHKHAIPEALARHGSRKNNDNNSNNINSNGLQECSSALQAQGIGKFDYECPNAKHLIVALGSNGIGNQLRGTILPALVAGLSSDRVVHVVNNANMVPLPWHQAMRKPWGWSSCDRRDFQCVFMPPSPCALSVEDLKNAYVLTKREGNKLAQSGTLPEGHDNDKVWITTYGTMPLGKGAPMLAKLQLNKTVWDLIDLVPKTDPRRPAMKQAANSLFVPAERRPNYQYAMATGRIEHAVVLYASRMNLRYTPQLEEAVAKSIPRDLNTETAFGLPIRASDKCRKESECLTFYQHMNAMNHLWNQFKVNGTTNNPTVVFTSESKAVALDQIEFASNTTLQRTLQRTFDFVTNLQDHHPGTGSAREIRNQNVSNDDTMLETMSSLKLQLLPRYSLGNCCSNFHVLLNDFLMEGCGAARDNTYTCLQEHPDPRFIVCCSWRGECPADRQTKLDIRNKNQIESNDGQWNGRKSNPIQSNPIQSNRR